MLNRKKIRWMITPVLAALLVSAAGAAAQESQQVLLDGDKASFEPVSTELVEINGVPTLTKTFELAPDVDPALLREEPFSQDGYWYRYQRMDKSDQESDGRKGGRGDRHGRRAVRRACGCDRPVSGDPALQQGRLYRRAAARRAEHRGGRHRVQHGHGQPPAHGDEDV